MPKSLLVPHQSPKQNVLGPGIPFLQSREDQQNLRKRDLLLKFLEVTDFRDLVMSLFQSKELNNARYPRTKEVNVSVSYTQISEFVLYIRTKEATVFYTFGPNK